MSLPDLDEGAPMLVTRRMIFADGLPVSFGALHRDATRFPDFPDRRQALGRSAPSMPLACSAVIRVAARVTFTIDLEEEET